MIPGMPLKPLLVQLIEIILEMLLMRKLVILPGTGAYGIFDWIASSTAYAGDVLSTGVYGAAPSTAN